MYLLSLLPLLSTLVLASPTPQTRKGSRPDFPTRLGCGTAKYSDGSSYVELNGDQLCNKFHQQVSSFNVAKGCVCYSFSSDGCKMDGSNTAAMPAITESSHFDIKDGQAPTWWYWCSGIYYRSSG